MVDCAIWTEEVDLVSLGAGGGAACRLFAELDGVLYVGVDDGQSNGAAGFRTSDGSTWALEKDFNDGTTMQFRARMTDSVDVNTTAAASITTGQWYFFAFGHDATNDEYIFRLDDAAPVTTSDSRNVLNTGNVSLDVGSRNTGGASLNGQVDALGWWGKILSDFELDSLYNSGDGDEYPFTPICWNYNAPYKGSKRRYKVSGPGPFPRYLEVPNNVDKTQGLMVDDGVPIHPSEYEVI